MKKNDFIVVLSLLTQVSAETNNIVVKVMTKTDKSWDNTKLKAYPKGQPEVTILNITISPNTKKTRLA